MALSVTARGTAASNASSATTYAFSPASNCTAGKTVVIAISADNSASGGSSNNISSVTDSLGNTWTKRNGGVFDNGAASAGVQGSIFETKQDAGTLTTGSTITVTFGASTTAKSYALWELNSAAGTHAVYQSGGVQAGATTASPSYTTGSITNGDAVVAAIAGEAGTTQTHTADADTTNGSWSSAQYSEVGSTTSGNVIASQVKVVTATATQTYNPTFGLSQDSLAFYSVYREVPDPQTLTLGLLDGSATLYAPTLLGKNTITLPQLGGSKAITATFTSGFEDSPLTNDWGVNGSAALDTTVSGRTGPQAVKVSETNGTTVNYVNTSFTASATVVMRFRFRVSAFPADGQILNFNGVSFYNAYLWITSAGVLKFNMGNGDVTGPSLSTGTWYTVEVYLDGTNKVGHWMVDGVAQTDPTSPTNAETFNNCFIGKRDTVAQGTYDLFADDVVVSKTLADYPIGDGYVDATDVWVSTAALAALYAPTLTPVSGGGAQTVTLGLLDGSAALYAPTLSPKNTLTVPLLDGSATLYAPNISSVVTVPLLDGAATLYAPNISSVVTVPLLDASAALYAPTVAPKNTLAVPLLDGAATLYAPTVAQASSTQTLTVPLLDGSATTYSPTLSLRNTLAVPLLNATATLYAPTLVPKNTLTFGLLDAAAALYAPLVMPAQFLTLGLLDAVAALYAPTVAGANIYYISPSGNDSTGSGTFASPWRTLSKAYATMVAGDITYARGGSYTGDATGDAKVVVTSTGTSGAPIKLLAYPGETPVFDGTGATITNHNYNIQYKAGAAYHELRGITFQNWAWDAARGSNGSANVIMDQTGGTLGDVNHITISGNTFTSGVATPNLNDWMVYVGGAAQYITITYNRITGGGTAGASPAYSDFGGGVQIFHTPVADNILIDHNLIGYCRFGVNLSGDAPTNVTITHNTFHHNNFHIMAQAGNLILARDNAGDNNTGGPSLVDDDGSPPTNFTHDHNYVDQTLDGPNYSLHRGSSAIAGALDGSDAGWLAYNEVTLGLLDGSATLYAPTASQASGSQSVTLGLLDASAALYAPTLLGKNLLSLGLLDGSATLYAPTLLGKNTLTLGLLDGAATLYSPIFTVGPVGVTLGLLDGAATLYAPTLAPKGTLTLGMLDGAAVLYAPVLTQIGTAFLVFPLLDGGATVYAPVLVQSLKVGGNPHEHPRPRPRFPWINGLRPRT